MSAPIPEAASARLFLSYKRSIPEDEALAQFLRRGLEAAGHELFIDVGMKVGTDWVGEIRRRIDWCDYLIVLLSKPAIESEMVQAEVRLAHQSRRRDGRPVILPIRVRYEGPLDYELDAYLARLQYSRWDSAEDSEGVLAELRSVIEGTSPRAPRPTTGIGDLVLSAPAGNARDRRRPSASEDPRVLASPGGTIKVDDTFYLRRDADELIEATARMTGQTLVIKAARQMGKSSLLIRYLAACKACEPLNKQFAYVDFQSFSDTELEDYPVLLRGLGQILLRAFRLDDIPDLAFATQLEFTNFVEDRVLKPVGGPVTFAMDEVDRILGRPYQGDFFSLLRHWHNQRGTPFSPWEDMDLALVIATEPYLLIADGDRSPFNVVPPTELGPFDRSSLDPLNESYGDLLSGAELDQLHELLDGHPYLTRLAFYRLVAPPQISFADLLKHASESEGPFGEHLRSRLFLLENQPDLLTALREMIVRGTPPSKDTYYRLHGVGLVSREGTKVVPANLLYARFFKRLQ